MHPFVLLLSLLAVALALHALSLSALLVALGALAVAGAWRGGGALGRMACAVSRLRYLLLLLVLSYTFFGGDVAEGARRALVLAVLAIAVERFFAVCRPAQVAAAITLLLRPLMRLNVPVDTFASRVAMTLILAPAWMDELAAARQAMPGQSLGDYADLAARFIARAEREPGPPLTPAELPPLTVVSYAPLALVAAALALAAGVS